MARAEDGGGNSEPSGPLDRPASDHFASPNGAFHSKAAKSMSQLLAKAWVSHSDERSAWDWQGTVIR